MVKAPGKTGMEVKGTAKRWAGLRRRGAPRGIEFRNHPVGTSTLFNHGEDNMVRSVTRGAYRLPESETLYTCLRATHRQVRGSSMRGNRESPETIEQGSNSVRLGKVCDHNPSLYTTCPRRKDRQTGEAYCPWETIAQRSFGRENRPPTCLLCWHRQAGGDGGGKGTNLGGAVAEEGLNYTAQEGLIIRARLEVRLC